MGQSSINFFGAVAANTTKEITVAMPSAPSLLTAAPISCLQIPWATNSSGNQINSANAVAAQVVSAELFGVGTAWGAHFTNGAGGAQPTDLYEATLLDQNGMDILAGLERTSATRLLASRSTLATWATAP